MTEITLPKKSFLATLDAFQTQFQLASPTILLETEPAGDRFMMVAQRVANPVLPQAAKPGPSSAPNLGPALAPAETIEVRAFGPCQTAGEPVSVEFDISQLQGAINQAYKSSQADSITLVVSDGVSVKTPA